MDYILTNGKFYTCDPDRPWADAVSVTDGKFSAVGSWNDISPCTAGCPVYDLGGRFVLPGLIDSHTHIGLSVMMDGDDDSFPIWDCKSKAEILETLTAYVKKHPFKLYYAAFFGQVEALAGETLTYKDLDEIVKHRPVILMEQECHSAWLNSGAMKFLKIKEDIEDMAAGYSYYERDAAGNLTGCIKEMTMLPLLSMTGNVSDKVMKSGILKIADYLVAHGVTTVYDAGNYFKEENTYKLLSELDRAGQLPLRISGSYIITSPDKAECAIEELKRYKSLYETDNLKFNTVKIMFDGTHRIHTAKLVEPYNDIPTCGGTMLDEDALYSLLSKLNEEGIDFHAHTVGEGASRMILDCVQRLIASQGELKINVTLAHLESQQDEDIPRFSDLGVFANFTPHWHGGIDYGSVEDNIHLLGEERARKLLRAKTMIDNGATVTFSSDEVTLQLLNRWNPFLGIEIGHTRREVTAGADPATGMQSGEFASLFPPESECLSLEDLIRGYTINGARQLGLEDQVGSISAGKDADMLILQDNIFETAPYEIHNMIPEAVIIRGHRMTKSSIGI